LLLENPVESGENFVSTSRNGKVLRMTLPPYREPPRPAKSDGTDVLIKRYMKQSNWKSKAHWLGNRSRAGFVFRYSRT